jgi:enoyl-CoA hydratase
MNGTFSSTFRMMASSAPTYKNIIVDREGKVGLITLNRPEALNALNSALM